MLCEDECEELKPERVQSSEKSTQKWEGNIKTDLTETGWMDVSWIYLAGIPGVCVCVCVCVRARACHHLRWRHSDRGGKNFDFPYSTNLKFTRQKKKTTK